MVQELEQCPICQEEFKEQYPNEKILPDTPLTLNEATGQYECLAGHLISQDYFGQPAKNPDSGLLHRRSKTAGAKTQKLEKLVSQENKNPEILEEKTNRECSSNTPNLQMLQDGDAQVTLKVREPLVETINELALSEKRTAQEWLQERLDWWLENEFR